MTKPTVDEIVAEPAGRRLDGWVATLVLGLPLHELCQDTRCAECGGEMRYCGLRARCVACGEWRYGPYREYSADIAAAWDIIVAVGARLFSARRLFEHHLMTLPGRLGWTPSLRDDECVGWPTAMTVFAHRMPELICKAALLAG